jgi:hypothetical protein
MARTGTDFASMTRLGMNQEVLTFRGPLTNETQRE